MTVDDLLSRSAKRQIIAFLCHRQPTEYSKEWSFLQNVSALVPKEAIEQMPSFIYRAICGSNLHWLTTSGDIRLAFPESTKDRHKHEIRIIIDGPFPENIRRDRRDDIPGTGLKFAVPAPLERCWYTIKMLKPEAVPTCAFKDIFFVI